MTNGAFCRETDRQVRERAVHRGEGALPPTEATSIAPLAPGTQNRSL